MALRLTADKPSIEYDRHSGECYGISEWWRGSNNARPQGHYGGLDPIVHR
jgi:hypothetical protein